MHSVLDREPQLFQAQEPYAVRDTAFVFLADFAIQARMDRKQSVKRRGHSLSPTMVSSTGPARLQKNGMFLLTAPVRCGPTSQLPISSYQRGPARYAIDATSTNRTPIGFRPVRDRSSLSPQTEASGDEKNSRLRLNAIRDDTIFAVVSGAGAPGCRDTTGIGPSARLYHHHS